MIELCCDSCGEHIAWISDAGPRGLVDCDECHYAEEAAKEAENNG